jgi:transcriptional regulator with XRE-family HTH domain
VTESRREETARYRPLKVRVRQLRTALGLTQAQLAERAGFDTTRIVLVESGHARPDLEDLEKLARALGVTPEELLAPSP